jgi:hypothetical protein
MIRAACHCGAVKFEIAEPPEWVLDCNCTICRRYGALWTYFEGADQAKLLMKPDPEATQSYLWNSEQIAFQRCKVCGCVTHMMITHHPDPTFIFGVNARMMAGLDPASVRIRRKDNSHSGFFWTRPDEPIEASRHPAMPPPAFDDWR